MPVQLRFQQVGSYPFPYATNGSGTAIAACRHNGDPALAFLTQTPQGDEIVFLHLHLSVSVEDGRFNTPVGSEVISGMAYEEATNVLWTVQGTGVLDKITGINSDTGLVTSDITVPANPGLGLAFNSLGFVRSTGFQLQAINAAGNIVGTVAVPPGSKIEDICAAGFYYVGSDTLLNKINMYGPFGNVIAECLAPPGVAGGIKGVAFDNISDFIHVAQLPTANGAIGAVGTPYHPDTPWNPTPWIKRHHVYLANEADQTIYFGYFYM